MYVHMRPIQEGSSRSRDRESGHVSSNGMISNEQAYVQKMCYTMLFALHLEVVR